MVRQPRHCVVLRGSPEETCREAESWLVRLVPDDVLWVSASETTSFQTCFPGHVKRHLGRSYDAVVVDLHQGIHADTIAQCEGFIWRGGALLLRMPPHGAPPHDDLARLAAFPYTAEQVTHRFWQRFERVVGAAPPPPLFPLAPANHHVEGTAEQDHVVEQLVAAWTGGHPTLTALVAERGRGKSSAIGIALRKLHHQRPVKVAITGPHPDAVSELLRFFADDPATRSFVEPEALLTGDPCFDVVVVDEAAQLAVPLLSQLALYHPHAHLVYATTTKGYEGTGRGFALRFLPWAERQPRKVRRLTLRAPIRFDADDPLEACIRQALLLDADIAPAAAFVARTAGDFSVADVTRVDRERLAGDELLLRDLFGLLVGAHYRTTPEDLHRALDAPNLDVHMMTSHGRVVAASLVAREGELPTALAEALSRGQQRIRGHALPETLAWHCARPDAASMRMLRSIRVAVHPAFRRRGLASRLVESVHAAYDVDLFGTLFGATPELLSFRARLGYVTVRVGISRGARTGEPAVTMVRPISPRAHRLVAELRLELSRALPRQLELLDAEQPGLWSNALQEALSADLPAVVPLSRGARDEKVTHYLASPQPFEVVAYAVTPWAREHADYLDHLTSPHRRLIEARVFEGASWRETAARADYPRVPLAMRELRRALQALRDAAQDPPATPASGDVG